MSYVGIWKFHSVGVISDEDEMVFLGAQEYISSPMPYVDTEDEEAVEDEVKERKQMVGSCVEVCEDGKLYMLMPPPEGVSDEEVEAAAAAGIINVRGGMLTQDPIAWEERNGELWAELGMSEDGFDKISDGDGFLCIVSSRYTKEQ